ncbi:MAG: zinc ribbon domain-containing protein [Methylococcaceae bacterium]|nr:MAG: zinc ribbon domain-containing protein [Methylococcaceae bacterium]
MPIYEYQCQACGHQLESLQKISDAPLKDCPACKQPRLIKKISAAGFRLKGGGWYETDFKSGSDKKKNLAGDGQTPTPAAKSEPTAGSGASSSSGNSTSAGSAAT